MILLLLLQWVLGGVVFLIHVEGFDKTATGFVETLVADLVVGVMEEMTASVVVETLVVDEVEKVITKEEEEEVVVEAHVQMPFQRRMSI